MMDTLVESVLRRLQPAPFWEFTGAVLNEAGPGSATVTVPNRTEFGRSGNTGDGTAHGGVVATAIDMAASCALITMLAADEGRSTVDLAIHFLAPVRDDLVARATVRRRGRRIAVIDIELESGGKLAALGRATFAITPAGAN